MLTTTISYSVFRGAEREYVPIPAEDGLQPRSSPSIFESQTSALRAELGDHHTYDFLEASIPCPVAPEIRQLFANEYTNVKSIMATPQETGFAFYEENPESMLTALEQLDEYIEEEGPFDGVVGFCHGAGVAAEYIIHKFQQDPEGEQPFKCAILIGAGIPSNPAELKQGKIRQLKVETDGEIIRLPTAHIWGINDPVYDVCESVSKLCNSKTRAVFIHDGIHEVPNYNSKDGLAGAVKMIRRTVDRGLYQ
ncbi:hypothetical protein ETB97_006458 [Aspergillus alliaceus]|uniref:Serine hydrolase domain-containing protein n=2 Tax=Petromyces alliaceus TaxID=209559 RepID=A0A8H6E3H9_PETAA|nr:hypothetical protein ETB97_006458 [Aspergillus burnettii]